MLGKELLRLLLSLLAIQVHGGKMWHFTDVHLDPIYVVNATWSTNANTNHYCNGNVTNVKSQQAGVFGEPGGDCATPRSLYHSATQFMSKDPESDIVLFTGDFTQAGLRDYEGVVNTISEAWDTLAVAVPNASIYGTVGNHDAFPGDQFPYPYEGYRALSDIWGPWLTPEAKLTVQDGGYYSIEARPGLTIISINTLYLSQVNPYVKDGTNGAREFGYKMMDWFETALDTAHQRGHAVWVLGHVPSGDWLPAHELRYLQLIEKYASMIQGQFYGHKHEDFAKLTRKCDETGLCSGDPTGIVWVGPSLTEGWPSENPGIRQYVYGANDQDPQARYAITESVTFMTNLTEANIKSSVEWRMEYSTRQLYNMPDLAPASWLAVLNRMVTDNKTWADHYAHRRRLYDGPMSASSGPKCVGHNLTCAMPLICNMLFFQARLAEACTDSATFT